MHRFLFSFSVFVFSEASDLLFMNLCNKGKQPVLEAITHWPKVGLIYIVYNTNLISHFVLRLVCKSSWRYVRLVRVHNIPLQPTRSTHGILFYMPLQALCIFVFKWVSNVMKFIIIMRFSIKYKTLHGNLGSLCFKVDHQIFEMYCKIKYKVAKLGIKLNHKVLSLSSCVYFSGVGTIWWGSHSKDILFWG